MKKTSFLIFLFSMIFTTSFLFSQIYEASMCTKNQCADLSPAIKKGSIKALLYFGESHKGMWTYGWTTTHLRAESKKPKLQDAADEDPVILSENNEALEKWSCMYSPWSAMDGNPATAWSEGVKGPGIGEILIVKTDTGKPVYIWAGIGVNKRLHTMNNRPKKIRVYVLQALTAQQMIGQFANGIQYNNIKVLAQKEITLKDKFGYQTLDLPAHTLKKYKSITVHGEEKVAQKDITFVAVEILSVYRGSKYDDTCISEISNKGKN